MELCLRDGDDGWSWLCGRVGREGREGGGGSNTPECSLVPDWDSSHSQLHRRYSINFIVIYELHKHL